VNKPWADQFSIFKPKQRLNNLMKEYWKNVQAFRKLEVGNAVLHKNFQFRKKSWKSEEGTFPTVLPCDSLLLTSNYQIEISLKNRSFL